MQKGQAIVGMVVSFMLGIFVMYGYNKSKEGVAVSPEPAAEVAPTNAASGGPIPIEQDDPTWGKADALVTIVEISDFQCPFCSRVNGTLKQIKETYGDKVRFVWKHNPLPFHKQAQPAHEAAQAVFELGGNDAFWKFHDLAFANQKALTPENFEKWATEAGVDAAKFKAALADNKKLVAAIQKDMAGNRKIGATGTPAFRINGVTLAGAQPFERFKTVIDEQLKEADALVKKGTKASEVSALLTKKNFTAPKAQEEPKEDTTVWKVEVREDDPVKGGADALVTIVEFSDFECPFCSRVNPTLKSVMEKYGQDVRVVWKDNPLPFHKNAKPAAAIARAAFKKGGSDAFWKAHDLLFGGQKSFADPSALKGFGAQLGLSAAEVDAAIADKAIAARIAESQTLASDVGARGTPHFFINGRRLSGAQPLAKFEELIDDRLKVARALVEKGTPRSQVYAAVMKSAKGPPPPEKRDVPPVSAANPTKGKAGAKVVIQEFSDFQCPFCSRVNPTVAQLLKTYPNDIQMVWRNMPLPFHKQAPLAAEAAQEAFVQRGATGFWAMHDKLFDNQKALERADLDKYAAELGLDMAKFKAALDGRTHQKHVEADVEAARKAGVRGTPAFLINGYFVNGAQPYENFDKLVQVALKEAK